MSNKWKQQLKFDYDREPSRDILCLDVRSFYASVEAIDRGLDPQTTSLVVMSYPKGGQDGRGSGLILASSPTAKARFGISNVNRARDLPYPYPPDLYIVPPRMNRYMEMNYKVNQIYQQFVAPSDHHVYSVDESFMDITNSQSLFKTTSPYDFALMVQQAVKEQTGLIVAIGIGDNPLLSKLAMDNQAKKTEELIAEWRYSQIPNTVWKIPKLTDFWGIGRRTAQRLNRLGIFSIDELAQSNYYDLKDELGIIGGQLYAHAWGIDRSFLGETYTPQSKSLGNSQVLPRDYTSKEELRIVVLEMADQVGTRLRKEAYKTQVISLSLGYSMNYRDAFDRSRVRAQRRISATNNTLELHYHFEELLNQLYHHGQIIRSVAVNTTDLVPGNAIQYDLFTQPETIEQQVRLDQVKDLIRHRYGFSSLIYAHSLMEGGRAIERSKLVGGHAGGLSGVLFQNEPK